MVGRGGREPERARSLPGHKHGHYSKSFPLFSPDPVPNYGILSFQTRPTAVAHPPNTGRQSSPKRVLRLDGLS